MSHSVAVFTWSQSSVTTMKKTVGHRNGIRFVESFNFMQGGQVEAVHLALIKAFSYIRSMSYQHKNCADMRFFVSGAVKRIRTADLFLTKEVLCLLSYNSIKCSKDYYTISNTPCQSFFSLKNDLFQPKFNVYVDLL